MRLDYPDRYRMFFLFGLFLCDRGESGLGCGLRLCGLCELREHLAQPDVRAGPEKHDNPVCDLRSAPLGSFLPFFFFFSTD